MDSKNLSVTEIGLNNRCCNALRRAGIHTAGQLMEQTEESLRSIRNLGASSIGLLVEKIRELRAESAFSGPEETVASSPENDPLGSVSPRAYNLLTLSGHTSIADVLSLRPEDLMAIPGMDAASAAEIRDVCRRYARDGQTAAPSPPPAALSLEELLARPEGRKQIRDTLLTDGQDKDLDVLGLPTRPANALRAAGLHRLSDIVLLTDEDLRALRNMGEGSVRQVRTVCRAFLNDLMAARPAPVSGERFSISDEQLRAAVLDLYPALGFAGLSMDEMIQRQPLLGRVPPERLKKTLGRLLAAGELEYCDYRCYRVYRPFRDWLDEPALSGREREILLRRLRGETLEAIGQTFDLTRERVRQIIAKAMRKLQSLCQAAGTRFDEDYYRYFYENYAFDEKELAPWLGLSAETRRYFALTDTRKGKKELAAAPDDRALDPGLRLKIKNYLNRDLLYLDGVRVSRTRAALEEHAVATLCREEMSFREFALAFNSYLRDQGVEYDEKLYYSDEILPTRKNRLREADYLLWKQNEKIRYYDIKGRDYAEMLDGLGLDSFENTEISTRKLAESHPDLMEKYGLLDHYELHNLLRKILPEGSFHDLHFERTPILRFGSFDRDGAILDLLIECAPISAGDLADRIQEEFGYDRATVIGGYLQRFSAYCHQGIYSVDQKVMPAKNRELLLAALDDDFYYMDELRRLYLRLVPDGDPEEINPYNLKEMGFAVLSRVALRNFSSMESYFVHLLTSEEILDIRELRRRFSYLSSFSSTLSALKNRLRVVEFEPNQLIRSDRLERAGVDRTVVDAFRDRVDQWTAPGAFFSIASLRRDGFEDDLFELGFSDWFYAGLLASDERFASGTMFSSQILRKGGGVITIRDFLESLVRERDSVDVYDLLSDLDSVYGCRAPDRADLLYKLRGTEVYHDPYLDRLYASVRLYEREIEEAEELP